MELYAAFLIGLVGSLHCIGMCGPIALMLPVNSENKLNYFTGRFLYNSGRILTYAFMGLLTGYIGSKIIIYGYQQSLSILLGVLILLFIIRPQKYFRKTSALNPINKIFTTIKTYPGRLFKRKSAWSLLLIGLLNGFLPCGLVYLGLSAAASSGTALNGLTVMLLFGAGTLPVMFAVSSFFRFFPIGFRNRAARIAPYFGILLAVIFILRGLNLGIPYISPNLDKAAMHQSESCH
jgi:sulfite exporter TauE/SafE